MASGRAGKIKDVKPRRLPRTCSLLELGYLGRLLSSNDQFAGKRSAPGKVQFLDEPVRGVKQSFATLGVQLAFAIPNAVPAVNFSENRYPRYGAITLSRSERYARVDMSA